MSFRYRPYKGINRFRSATPCHCEEPRDARQSLAPETRSTKLETSSNPYASGQVRLFALTDFLTIVGGGVQWSQLKADAGKSLYHKTT